MKTPRFKLILLAGVAAVAACAASAQMPVQDIDPMRHGNLAAAQRLVVQAFEKLSDAQFDNDSRLGGHAGRAKELLRENEYNVTQTAAALGHENVCYFSAQFRSRTGLSPTEYLASVRSHNADA